MVLRSGVGRISPDWKPTASSLQEWLGRRVHNRVHGIQPQCIHVRIGDPWHGVVVRGAVPMIPSMTLEARKFPPAEYQPTSVGCSIHIQARKSLSQVNEVAAT